MGYLGPLFALWMRRQRKQRNAILGGMLIITTQNYPLEKWRNARKVRGICEASGKHFNKFNVIKGRGGIHNK